MDDNHESVQATFMSPELQTAYLNGDFEYIKQATNATKRDFEPIADLLENHEETEVFNMVESDDGTKTAVINAPSAMYFTQVKDHDHSGAGDEERIIRKATIKVGYYTKNGGKAESNRNEGLEFAEKTTVLAISTAIGFVAGSMVTKTLTGRVSATAAAAAIEAQAAYAVKSAADKALRKAIETGDKAAIDAATLVFKEASTKANAAFLNGASKFVKPSVWSRIGAFFEKWPKATGGIVGTLVAVAVQIFLDFVWGKINKDFFVNFEIYNFDKNPWKVDQWHHDNGIVAGGGPFTEESMPAVTDQDRFPWSQPTKGWLMASGVTYVFQNSFTVLDGVGIALRVIQENQPSTGLSLGYIIKAMAENRLTVKPGAPSSIKDWYNEESNWPSDRPLSMECEVNDVKIKVYTDALEGKDDHVYQFFITIGG